MRKGLCLVGDTFFCRAFEICYRTIRRTLQCLLQTGISWVECATSVEHRSLMRCAIVASVAACVTICCCDRETSQGHRVRCSVAYVYLVQAMKCTDVRY